MRYKSDFRFYSFAALAVIPALFLSSCSPVPYGVVGQNVPMLKNKGEVNLNAGYAETDDAEGISAQVGVAIDSSWAAIASFYSLNSFDENDWDGKGHYFEAGIGKYGQIRKHPLWIYDGYVGLGFGGIQNEFEASTLDVKFIKPFVQGSFGISYHYVEAALTTRFAVVNFTDQDFSFTDPEAQAQAAGFFDDNKTKFLFEPGITIRGGYRGVKANLQYCISSFSIKGNYEDVNINNQFLTVGLNVLIGKRYLENK